MRGVYPLPLPDSLQAHGIYRCCGVNVLAPGKKILDYRQSNAKCQVHSFDSSVSSSQLVAGIKCYGQNIGCLGFQPSFSRERHEIRSFYLGGIRQFNPISEPKSLLRTRCDASDRESVSTTTAADSEEQQKTGTAEINSSDGVEKGPAMKSGLSALDAYFSKLNGSSTGGNEVSKATVTLANSSSLSTVSVWAPEKKAGVAPENEVNSSAVTSKTDAGKDVQGLKALDAYFDKLKPKTPEPVKDEVETPPEKPVEPTEEEIFLKALLEAKEEYEKYKASQRNSERKLEESDYDEDGNELDLSEWEQEGQPSASSDFINLVVALNVAVYLFGLASPHEAFGITDSSLPFVYGAKVNELILAGQWWRLITPMFLHASFLHVGLGSWALLAFGPAVESAYGTFGFAMIYFLGGIFGNLMSFFHTNEWTVGGTGPIYALVGTWLVYLLKNRETIGKEIADDMIRKVIILSALNVALWNSLPVDDWTHLGAVLVGLFFGLLASPTMQLNVSLKELDPESKEEMGEAFLWFNEGLSPARLTLVFIMCLGIFYVLYQLAVTGSGDFYLLQDKDFFS